MIKAKNPSNDYFKAARDWHFDRFQMVQINCNRWFLAFVISFIAVILLVTLIVVLLPLKTLVPMVVHQNTTTGEMWIERPKTKYVAQTDAQTQADIVRYIMSRESYMASDINQRFHLVMLLSDNAVGRFYVDQQANDNKESPVNVLGTQGIKTVRIEDIVFLDKAGTQEFRHFKQVAHNLAKVDFVTTTLDGNGNKKVEYWVATISWIYKGLPTNQMDAWDNWNGFTVTTYRVDQRNVEKSTAT